jgi:hypothetical protein
LKDYVGAWQITEMDDWDNDYINMETQAYIKIDRKGQGSFQFALVVGNIDGEIQDIGGEKRFDLRGRVMKNLTRFQGAAG